MQPKPDPSPAAAELRLRAEGRLREQHVGAGAARTETDTQRLVHELQVHQIELEMQNEELQRARDEMEAGLEKYSDLYDFAPVGYVTLDREGTILEANLTAATLLGIERSRLVRRRFGLYVTATDLAGFTAFLTRVFGSKGRESCEVTLRQDGKPPVEVRIEAVMTAAGRDCRAVVADITERRRAEADRLVLSKLESAGILAGGIAHDFNNLLTVILLDVELARVLCPPGDELANYLKDAQKTVFLARGLTQQLITFAKGGAPVRRPVRLAGVIEESARAALSGSRVRCEFSLAEGLWLVEADDGQIGQVIRNLALNAREAMPEGGVITIWAENVILGSQANSSLPAGDYVRVSIADRGGGIAKEVLPKIFDPYFTTKERGNQKGMGLGLTICHSVIQKHGGAIAVESTVGVGTTFHVHLPASSKALPHEPAPGTPGFANLRRAGRILVMDDEESLRNLIEATLRRLGHEVELVEDGQRAIEAYREAQSQRRPFDVVLLDLTVRAGLGGPQAVRGLLKLDPAVKAVVMSGHAQDPVMLEPERHGFVGCLPKPFDGAKLQEILSPIIEN
jgi:two-component system cell cycle sensor histidine kinase/response regulator CckA